MKDRQTTRLLVQDRKKPAEKVSPARKGGVVEEDQIAVLMWPGWADVSSN